MLPQNPPGCLTPVAGVSCQGGAGVSFHCDDAVGWIISKVGLMKIASSSAGSRATCLVAILVRLCVAWLHGSRLVRCSPLSMERYQPGSLTRVQLAPATMRCPHKQIFNGIWKDNSDPATHYRACINLHLTRCVHVISGIKFVLLECTTIESRCRPEDSCVSQDQS